MMLSRLGHLLQHGRRPAGVCLGEWACLAPVDHPLPVPATERGPTGPYQTRALWNAQIVEPWPNL